MDVKDKKLARISLIIFFIGYLWGMVILGISVVGDFEAFMFKPTVDGDVILPTLKCPVMMDASETSSIKITLSNPAETRVSPSVWTYVSAGFVTYIRQDRVNLFLEPDEKKELEWTISGKDAAFEGSWVLVKIFVNSQYPLPSNDAVCGVFVADMLGFTGVQIHTFSLVMSVLLIGLGMGLWFKTTRHLKGLQGSNLSRSLLTIGGMLLAGLLTSVIGSYLMFLSALLFVLSLITTLSFLFWQGLSL